MGILLVTLILFLNLYNISPKEKKASKRLSKKPTCNFGSSKGTLGLRLRMLWVGTSARHRKNGYMQVYTHSQMHNWSPLYTVEYTSAVYSHSKIVLSLNIWT